jgi:hypothetical protein
MESITLAPVQTWEEAIASPQVTALQAPEGCKDDLSDEAKVTCQSYTNWNNYLADFENFIVIIRLGSDSLVPESIKKQVEGFLKAFFDLSASAQQAFQDGIVDINAGKPFEVVIPPADKPDWPIDHPTSAQQAKEWIDSIWQLVSSALVNVLEKMESQTPGPIEVALDGLLVHGKQVVEDLVKAFSKSDT